MQSTENEDMATRNNDLVRTSSSQEATIERVQSRTNSITHPYRTLMKDTSFPRCHLIATPGGRTETYTRSLFMLGHGTPIWDPLGNVRRSERHIKSGVSIGDVGVIGADGDFECYFNIFLPVEDAIQPRMCPPNLEPLQPPLSSADIAMIPSHFSPGTTLVSKGVEVSRRSSSPLHIDFNVNAREGSILVLPDGASREDLISTARVQKYIQKHALSWYRFINQKMISEVILPNGSLYVVTGCDKATSWAIAASPEHFESCGLSSSIHYQADKSPVWQDPTRMSCRSSKVSDASQKFSVFVRGMKVAVSIPDWTKYILHNEPPSSAPFFNVLAVPIMGLRAKYQSFIERRQNYPEKFASQATRFIFHPSEIILQFLLEESPSSSIAIAEDFLWRNIADNGLSDGSAPCIDRLLSQILEHHDVLSEDGLATLISRSSAASKGTSRELLKILFYVPNLIGQEYSTRRRRRDIAQKLSKIFPGPRVPVDQLDL